MLMAPLPPDETSRLAAVRALGILDTPPEAEFDALVRAASLVCGVPISLLSLIDAERQWFKASVGLPGISAAPRVLAFCSHAILAPDLFEIPDAAEDPRFADNPLVTGPMGIRFYAGAPMRLSDGCAVGSLCVIDRQPRHLDDTQREVLRCLARTASSALESWRARHFEQQVALALQASEDRLRRLYESTPAMLHSIDDSGRLLAVSDTWLAKLGYTRNEVLGRSFSDFLTPGSQEYSRLTVLPTLFASGRCDDIQYQIVAKTGEIIDVRLSAILERDGDGEPLRSLTVIEDVTLRLRAEAALSEKRERLANIVDGTNAGTWEWNLQTGTARFNDRWAEHVGFTPAELEPLSDQTWFARLHPDDRTRCEALLAEHLAGRSEQFECETRLRHRDGRWVWVLDRGRVMTWTEDGEPEWMFGTQLDISERKQQEELLRKSGDLLDRMGRLAGVGGWELDLQSGEIYWSAELCQLHGVAPGYQPALEEAIGFHAPEARPAIRAAIAEASAGGGGWDLELPLIRADGCAIWVHSVGSVTFADGRPARLTGAIQDVTERVAERRALQSANERVTLATDSGGIGIWDWDLANRRLVWDAGMYRLYGRQPDSESAGFALWRRHVHPDDLPRVERDIRAGLKGSKPFDTEFRVSWDDGSVHYLRGAARVTRNAAGRAVRMVGVNWDISEPRRLAAELARQHELLRVTLQSIGDAVITTDAEGRIVWLNPVAERMTGWGTAEAAGRPVTQVFQIINEDTREPTQSPVAMCLAQGQVVGLANHTVLIARDGGEFGIEDSAAPIRNDRGEMLGVVLVFHDVTEQRRLSGEMTYRASHDALTGLVNRAEFEIRLRRLLHRSHADRSLNALLYIDLDQFKIVNDSCGHAVGDQLLIQVSKLFSEIVRSRDTLARLGGDEFAVILDYCSGDQALRLGQQICDRMEDFRFVHDGKRFRVGASIGLVPVDSRWTTMAAILQAADTSCYAAKEAGRNRVHAWFDTDQAMRTRHGETQWATRLEQALDEDRFVLFAQRIAALRGGVTGMHAEVLLRMLDGDDLPVLPGAFLSAAERFHLASRIDRWVLRRVVHWMKTVPSLGFLENLSTNLSGQSVGDRAFHRWAIDLLAAAGPEICHRLCLEITETAAVTNLADAALFIEQIRGIGVRVALDDFGAGASSFGYLKNMPVDFLKIDGQFIRNLGCDALDEAAVRCFADVAKVVGMKTVAEFVDHPLILDQLRRIGIDFAQGFYIHRPAPIDELLPAAGEPMAPCGGFTLASS
jgi:diguanylate cyclase (GGDEF)-like protein/PAS domain S-box-containing protein